MSICAKNFNGNKSFLEDHQVPFYLRIFHKPSKIIKIRYDYVRFEMLQLKSVYLDTFFFPLIFIQYSINSKVIPCVSKRQISLNFELQHNKETTEKLERKTTIWRIITKLQHKYF